MTMAVVNTFLVSALLVTGAAVVGAGTEQGEEAKYLDVLQNYQNISQPQLEYLRKLVVESAEEMAHSFVARFTEVLTFNETERSSPLEGLPLSGRRSFRGGGREGEGTESIADAVRRLLREGLPSRGVPPLDPLQVQELPEINVDIVDVLQLHAILSNLSFDGLAGFREEVDIDYDIRKIPPIVTVDLVFDVLFPRLHLLTQYQASGYAEAGLDIRGEGPINIDIFRLRVQGAISIRGTLLSMKVEPCDITISSRSMNLEIEGLFGGGLLSQLAGEIVSDMINEYVWDLVFETISPIVENGVCTKLRSVTTQEWLVIIWKILGILK